MIEDGLKKWVEKESARGGEAVWSGFMNEGHGTQKVFGRYDKEVLLHLARVGDRLMSRGEKARLGVLDWLHG